MLRNPLYKVQKTGSISNSQKTQSLRRRIVLDYRIVNLNTNEGMNINLKIKIKIEMNYFKIISILLLDDHET